MNLLQCVPWSDCLRERQNFRASMDVIERELSRVLTNSMRGYKSKRTATTCVLLMFSCAAFLRLLKVFLCPEAAILLVSTMIATSGRGLGGSNFRNMRRVIVSHSQPIRFVIDIYQGNRVAPGEQDFRFVSRFVRLNTEHAQSHGKSVNRGIVNHVSNERKIIIFKTVTALIFNLIQNSFCSDGFIR